MNEFEDGTADVMDPDSPEQTKMRDAVIASMEPLAGSSPPVNLDGTHFLLDADGPEHGPMNTGWARWRCRCARSYQDGKREPEPEHGTYKPSSELVLTGPRVEYGRSGESSWWSRVPRWQ